MENSVKNVAAGASSPSKQELRAKDLIALGVFGLIYFVATMLVMGVLSMSVAGFLVAPAVSSILAGIVWTYLRVRVPKPWAMLIPGFLCGIVMFLIGTGWPVAVSYFVGALLAEGCSAIGKYKSFLWNSIGYAFVSACFMVGSHLPLIAMPQYYLDMLSASGGVEYGQQIMNTITPAMLCGLVVLAFVTGIVGSLLGRLLLKRHFERAGIA